MRKFIKLIRDKNCFLGIKFFLLLSLFSIFYSLFAIPRLPPQIPFFYSRPWGEDQLGRPYFLWFLSLGFLLIGFLNITLACLLYEKSSLLARILVWGSVLTALIIGLATFKIISLVT